VDLEKRPKLKVFAAGVVFLFVLLLLGWAPWPDVSVTFIFRLVLLVPVVVALATFTYIYKTYQSIPKAIGDLNLWIFGADGQPGRLPTGKHMLALGIVFNVVSLGNDFYHMYVDTLVASDVIVNISLPMMHTR
jgi:hypothetical protein